MTRSPSPFKITICGLDELGDFCDARVSHVLSILDPLTPSPDAFGAYSEHARLELRFHDVVEDNIPGYDAPQRHHVEALLGFGKTLIAEKPDDAHLLVHCHAGISRSTAASALLLAQARPDWSSTEIVAEIGCVRSKAWPNLRMIEFGDELLGRGGSLIKAVRTRHHEMARAFPKVAEFMREAGRDRELDD